MKKMNLNENNKDKDTGNNRALEYLLISALKNNFHGLYNLATHISTTSKDKNLQK